MTTGTEYQKMKEHVAELERKLADLSQQCTDSEQKFASLFETSTDAIILLTKTGAIVDCNQPTISLYETGKPELIGQYFWALSPQKQPDGSHTKDKAIALFNQALNSEKTISNWQVASRKGYLFEAEIQITTIQLSDRQLLLLRLCNITQQSLTANSLNKSKPKFRKFFENSLLGNVITLPDYSFSEVNDKAASVLGYSKSELQTMNWQQICCHSDRANLLSDIDLIFNGKKNEFTREIRLMRKNGDQFYALVAVTPLKNGAGSVYAMLTSFLDISDRKLAENALRQSQQRLSSIFENAPLGIVLLDTRGNLFMWNERFVSILEARGQRIETGYISKHMLPEDVEDARHALEELIIGKSGSLVMTKPYFPEAGKTLWLQVTASAIRDEMNNDRYIICMIEDITLQKNISESLKASERRFRTLFTHMRSGFMILDVLKDTEEKIENFRFLEVNEAIDKVTGVPQKLYIGRLASSLMRKKAHFWFPYIQEILDKQTAIRDEFYIEDTGRYLEITAYPIHDNQVAAILEDVSERKMNETSLIVNEQKFRSLAENNQDAIIRYDKHKRVNYLNRQAEQLFALRLIDIMSQPLPNHVWKRNQQRRWAQTLDDVLISGKSKHIETHHVRKGKQVIMLWRLTPEFSGNGKIISVLAVSRDITLIKEAQQELLVAKEKAEESDKLKSAFLANMSHEIRTPLNGIMGFAELLKLSNVAEEEKQDFLENITQSGYKLLNIINDILDLSKIEAGQINIVRNRFSVNRMLNDLYKLFQPKLSLSDSQVKLILTTALTEKESHIYSDEGRVRQIMINLVDNALKFTEKGKIEFGYTIPDESHIRFFVKDSGIGIPKDKRKAIFERFRQAQDTHLNKYGGTGLGLSIAKGFAELLGGTIDFTSEVGKGTTFCFTLPFPVNSVLSEKTNASDVLPIDPEMYDWVGKSILLIDDDRSNFFLIRRLLKGTGCEINFAQNGGEGLDALVKEQYSAVLMDIRLPDINGFDLTEKLRKENNRVPIIFQTANVMEADRQKAFDMGASDFLAKPLDFEELFQTLDKFLK